MKYRTPKDVICHGCVIQGDIGSPIKLCTPHAQAANAHDALVEACQQAYDFLASWSTMQDVVAKGYRVFRALELALEEAGEKRE